jgi:MGT family glycosyltransferase
LCKIVYFMPPAHGHVNPALPVVQELIQRGEQVICYNTEEFRSRIEHVGAAFRPYPPTELTSGAISALVEDGNLSNVTVLVLRAAGQILPALLDELARERPKLIIFDSIALWGKMAATELGVPGAASISHFVMDQRHMTYGDMLRIVLQGLPNVPGLLLARRRLVRRYGNAFPSLRPLFPMRDRLNVVFTARDLQPDTPRIDATFRFVGPSINRQTRDETIPVEASDQRRVTYISLGTVHAPQPAFIKACFDAFADYPARFIFSVGRQTTPAGPVPANFTVYPSVPQLEILERTDIFITHGGLNSVHEGLYYGVPLILIPQQFEQLLNARCVAARGAGLVIQARLAGQPVTAAMLRRALDAVSSDSSYREAAGTLRQSIRKTGGYRQAADEIQAYMRASTPTS